MALTIEQNSIYENTISDPYVDRSSKSSNAHNACQKYRSGQPPEWKTKEYSTCYRDAMNKASISKQQACKKKDWSYGDILQFNWKFNEDIILQTDNFGFVKLQNILYYIITDHIGETDTMRNYYLFSYDCKTQKAKQHYEWQWLRNWNRPLWIDRTTNIAYLLKWWPVRWSYDPYKILQINMKTNSIKEYQLFTENIIKDDDSRELTKSTFVRKQSLMSTLVGWIESRWVESFQKYYDKWWREFTILIDELSNLRGRYTDISLSNLKNWVGKLIISKPWYTITMDIDFTKKVIR
jgi:hypothetical protein